MKDNEIIIAAEIREVLDEVAASVDDLAFITRELQALLQVAYQGDYQMFLSDVSKSEDYATLRHCLGKLLNQTFFEGDGR